jgi:hypothetical protein
MKAFSPTVTAVIAGCVALAFCPSAPAREPSPPPVIHYNYAKGDFILDLDVDFASGRPVVKGGECFVEIMSGKVEPGKDCDFQVLMGDGLKKGTFVNPQQKTPLRQLEIVFDGEKLVLDEIMDP